MATAAPQAIDLVMNTFANASGQHVEEIIKALQALPQCTKANIEATNMSAKMPSGVKKSRSKKERSKQEKPRTRQRQGVAHLVDGLRFRYTASRASTLAHQ